MLIRSARTRTGTKVIFMVKNLIDLWVQNDKVTLQVVHHISGLHDGTATLNIKSQSNFLFLVMKVTVSRV